MHIHVVLVSTYSPVAVGGIGQFVHDFGIELHRRGLEVTVIYRYETPEFPMSEALSTAAQLIELRPWNLKGLRTVSLNRRTAAWIHRHRDEIDILHVLNPMPMAASALREGNRHNIPSVVTIYAKYPASGNPFLRWVNRRAERILLSENEVLVYESENTQRAFPGHPGRVILNGIDTGYFRRDLERGARLKASAEIEPEELVVLFLGRMDRLKGISIFVEGLSILKRQGESFRALLVGSIEVPDLIQQIRDHEVEDRVKLIGPVGKLDVLDYYCASDIFVLPSYLEGISSSLIEAMSTELPAIVTNVGANPEVVRDGVEGFLIPPGRSDLLAAAIERVLHDPDLRKRLGRAARTRVQEKFSLGAMTGEYLTAYSVARAKVAP